MKVLGLWWDPHRDVFCYKVADSPAVLTKRGILSRIAKIYDYNGYISPVVFALKVLLQRLWVSGVGWDDPLPAELQKPWEIIQDELHVLEQISIPRCILPGQFLAVQLIGFCDASALGMAAVVYLRVEIHNKILGHLMKSKT